MVDRPPTLAAQQLPPAVAISLTNAVASYLDFVILGDQYAEEESDRWIDAFLSHLGAIAAACHAVDLSVDDRISIAVRSLVTAARAMLVFVDGADVAMVAEDFLDQQIAIVEALTDALAVVRQEWIATGYVLEPLPA